MILRPAADEDLKTVISWIKDQEACKLWAGPVVRFPLALQRLKQDIAYSNENTFAMQDAAGKLLGLGQFLDKANNRIHLARIIVAPNRRGKGWGGLLCRLLVDEGLKLFGDVSFTLNVYSDNANAVKLYQKLGFKAAAAPSDSIPDEGIVHMALTAARKAKPT
ncbi:MAG: GNAT family N-acetyltransferase [Deltaproteobacteria bacterium]|jgi:ribosomal protein S18 acetylase RimI-like enzyme|nr:GNAT family N-acetyltransferase [Deltaproteobacteria bacterium]